MPTFERLVAGTHEVVAAVTQPERRRGRGRKSAPPPVAACAGAHGIPVLQPEKVGAPESVSALEALDADIGVVVAFGQFLTRRVRELPRCGYLINAHASLLPRHRGAAPIAYALLSGDTRSGVSIMRVEKEMDAGPVALVRETPIAPDDDAGSLGERLAALAADGVAEALELVVAGRVTWTEQDHALATEAPKVGAEDTALRFDEPALLMERRVRAFAPSPGAHTAWRGERLRILGACAEGGPTERPGLVRIDADGVRVATARGWLRLLRLQRAGAKVLDIEAFQHGRGFVDGEILGAPEIGR